MSIPSLFNLRFTGDYSLAASVALAASAAFVECLRREPGGESQVLDLAFPLEGAWSPVGVRVYQHPGGVCAHVLANPGQALTPDVRATLERILSLDVDGAGFADVAARDDVVAGLRHRHAGIRPVVLPAPTKRRRGPSSATSCPCGRPRPLRPASPPTTAYPSRSMTG